jgi:predicted CoA-binding protein
MYTVARTIAKAGRICGAPAHTEKGKRMTDWRDNLIEDDARIAEILRETRRIAVLGIKTEERSAQPAFYVPAYLQDAGYEIVPVPVYHPEATRILGQPVYRSLAAVPGPIDLVDIFRRSADVAQHVDDILEVQPRTVWMQSGIRNAEVAQRLAEAGIRVVQNRCLMIDHRRLVG